MDMVVVVVYHWPSGAYVNTFDDEFDLHYGELCAQYGQPAVALAEYRKAG